MKQIYTDYYKAVYNRKIFKNDIDFYKAKNHLDGLINKLLINENIEILSLNWKRCKRHVEVFVTYM